MAALSALRSAGPPVPRLRVLQASLGATIHLVPIADVLYFEAADKYIKVVTADPRISDPDAAAAVAAAVGS